MSIKKTMTWVKMQEHQTVDHAVAFYQLARYEILDVFDLTNYDCDNNVVKTIITEEHNLITVELITDK